MTLSDFGAFQDIYEKVEAHERLTFSDGIRLYESDDLPTLGKLAQIVRTRLNSNKVFYSVNLHINHTNVCVLRCLFCAFARRPGEPDGYVFSTDEIQKKVREGIEKWQINEVHIVGGHNPDLGMDYYLDMFQKIYEVDPGIYIKALTAPEIFDIAVRTQQSYRSVLEQFCEAGMNGMPGGGAEILTNRSRKETSPQKCDADQWIEVMEQAHIQEMRTTATMMFGHMETLEERVEHLQRNRDLQDITKGFTAFI